jgi:uncharacterized damage-inducible protein DinB
MQAQLAADLAVLEELYEALSDFVGSLSDAELNWTPIPGEANSIAALVTHTAGSVDSWLARAVGEPIARDRDAEFRARASAPALQDRLARSLAEARRRFAQLESADLTATLTVQRTGHPEPQTVSSAWCIEHALIHAGEHWGQIQLTKQIYRPASG